MSFFVGYDALPDRDRRFLLGAVPLGLIGLGALGAGLGGLAASRGGGRWETGTPVTLSGRIGMIPQPVLWTAEHGGVILAGIGKRGADPYIAPLNGQTATLTGIRIRRGNCFMLGVTADDVVARDLDLPPAPQPSPEGTARLAGEILDAQCYMGIMNPGYGRTHRGCATLCIRGGQPAWFLPGGREGGVCETDGDGGAMLLAARDGTKVNAHVLDHIARPIGLAGEIHRIGNLRRLSLGGLASLS